MPYKITNVSLEHQHALKRRLAARLQMEPVIAGKRLLLRQSMTITEDQYRINKETIDQCVKDGILSIESTIPFIPIKFPEDKIRGLQADAVAIDELQDEAVVEKVPVEELPSRPVQQTQATNPHPHNPPSGGFNPQRRDDRKRGR